MATNNFKAFGTGAGANVTSQADYESLNALLVGFQSGKASSAQINKALRQSSTISAVIGQLIANTGADAFDDGDVTGLVTKLTNALMATLRLSAGVPAIGMPFFWPSSVMPNTVMTEWTDMVFLKFNGASFSATAYPKLALVIPSLTLPEARGEFLRIWDDGRGVDPGRSLFSSQGDAIRNITGSFVNASDSGIVAFVNSALGAFSSTNTTKNFVATGSLVGSGVRDRTVNFSAEGSGVPVAAENRPRNIAFNFLVRAK